MVGQPSPFLHTSEQKPRSPGPGHAYVFLQNSSGPGHAYVFLQNREDIPSAAQECVKHLSPGAPTLERCVR